MRFAPSLIARLLLPALLLFSGCATAQRGAMLRAHTRMEHGRYEDALAKLSDAEKYTPPTPQLEAEISFLRGQCYEGLHRIPEAVGCYRYLADHFPDSIFAYQAREKIALLEPSLSPPPAPAPVSAPSPATPAEHETQPLHL